MTGGVEVKGKWGECTVGMYNVGDDGGGGGGPVLAVNPVLRQVGLVIPNGVLALSQERSGEGLPGRGLTQKNFRPILLMSQVSQKCSYSGIC